RWDGPGGWNNFNNLGFVSVRDARDFDVCATRQSGDGERCARGITCWTEIAAIHLIHCRVLRHVDKVHMTGDHVSKVHSGRAQHAPQVVHRHACLSGDTFGPAAGLWIFVYLSGDVKRIPRQHARGERSPGLESRWIDELSSELVRT